MIYEVNLYRVVGDTLIGKIPKVVQVPSKSDGSGAASFSLEGYCVRQGA